MIRSFEHDFEIVKFAGLEFSCYIADNALLVFVTFLTDNKHLHPFWAIAFTNIRSGAVGILQFLWAYIGETYLGTFWALLVSTILYSLGLGLLPVGRPKLNPEFYFVVFLLTVGNSGFNWFIRAEKQFIEDKEAKKRKRELQVLERQRSDQETHSKKLCASCYGRCPNIVKKNFKLLQKHWVAIVGNFVGSFVIPTIFQKNCEGSGRCLFGLGLNSQFVVSAFVLVGSLMIFCLGKLFYPIDEGPEGSLLLQIPRVVVAALKKSRVCCNYQEDGEYLVYLGDRENSAGTEQPAVESTRGSRRAALYNPSTTNEDLRTEVKKWRLCTIQQVAETEDCMSLMPLCITFLMLGIFAAIGDSYFIYEADGLDKHVGSIQLPIQVLIQIANITSMILSENICASMCTKYAIRDQPRNRFQGACRIGLGMLVSVVCSGFSAFVVARKEKIQRKHNPNGEDMTLPMSVFWLVPQMFMQGVVQGLAIDGVGSFFHHGLPGSMTRYAVLFTEVIIGVGVTLSAALSCLARLLGSRLYDSIDSSSVSPSRNFYMTLAVVSSLNLVIYVFVARRWISKRTHGRSEEGTNTTRPFQAEIVNS
ncbi:hypothetical protein Ancab_013952 [Ancistrocladus abbreviatus]